ncbi:MAG: hypothetical protein AB1797_02235 [bacterium]
MTSYGFNGILNAAYQVRCSRLDAGCSRLDARCSRLDAGCWMLEAGCSSIEHRASRREAALWVTFGINTGKQ